MNKKDLEKTKKLVNTSLLKLKANPKKVSSVAAKKDSSVTNKKPIPAKKPATVKKSITKTLHNLVKNPGYPISDELIDAALEARHCHGGQFSPLYKLSCGQWDYLTDSDLINAAREFETFKRNADLLAHAKELRRIAKIWPNKENEESIVQNPKKSPKLKLNGVKSVGNKKEAENIVKTVSGSKNLMKQFDYMCLREDSYRKAGIYDSEKALVFFTYLADAAAREAVSVIHRLPASKYTQFYTAETRRMAGAEFLKWYESGKYTSASLSEKIKSASRKPKGTSVKKNPNTVKPKAVKKEKVHKYPLYAFYVVDPDIKILAGNDYKEDAVESMKDLPPRLKAGARVLTVNSYIRMSGGKNPSSSLNWSNDKDLIGKVS
jgi:hypothetical protein